MRSRSPQFFRQYRDHTERPANWRGRRYWVVSRSLCGFRLFRLPNVGRKELRNAAALKAREWAPFAETGYHLDLNGDAARIWVWDAAKVRDAMLAQGVRPGRITVLPETALQARGEDGLRLIECIEGVEGQFWAEGELKASRWWPGRPLPEQWLEFVRSTGVAVHSLPPVPDPEPLIWRSRPWTNSGTGLELERHGREAALAGAALVIAGYAYLGGSLLRDAHALAEVDDRLREAQQRAAPIIADREQALASLDYLAGFAKLDPYPPQLSILARVAENLPSNGARLVAWSYQTGDLQFTVFSPASSVDILFYVKTYSSVPGFTDVTAERAENPRSLRVKTHLAK
jgi:hypothetical protein